MIIPNADVWSKHKYDLGLTSLASHRIDTGNHPPIAESLRRHPKVYFDVIDQSISIVWFRREFASRAVLLGLPISSW